MLTLNQFHFYHNARDLNAYPHFVSAEDRMALSIYDELLWVHHPVSGVWWPWLMPAGVAATLLQKLDQGLLGLSAVDQQLAVDLGLLIDMEHVGMQRIDAARELLVAREQVALIGWCKLSAITWPTYYNTVRYYVDTIAAQMVRDTQVELRINQHNSPLFRAVHSQIAALVNSVTNEPVKPSYCYLSKYLPGAVLHRHTDREQCRWNASICFHREGSVWPIYVEISGRPVEVCAELGEVIIYRGSTVPHWRDELLSGTQTVCFFHFVEQSFTGTLT